MSPLVYQKALFLCSLLPYKEWSATLFFQVEGNLQKIEEIVITAVDIYLQDIGTGAATEFEYGKDFLDCYDRNPELIDCRTGTIHSHNQMRVFYSGTDVNDLMENSENTDFYLSVVVNNKGECIARIGYRVEEEVVETVTWKVMWRNITGKSKRTYTTSGLRMNDGIVTLPESTAVFGDVISRYNHILEKKRTTYTPKYGKEYMGGSHWKSNNTTEHNNKLVPVQKSLFDREEEGPAKYGVAPGQIAEDGENWDMRFLSEILAASSKFKGSFSEALELYDTVPQKNFPDVFKEIERSLPTIYKQWWNEYPTQQEKMDQLLEVAGELEEFTESPLAVYLAKKIREKDAEISLLSNYNQFEEEM